MGLGAKANGDPVGNWQAQGAQGAGDIKDKAPSRYRGGARGPALRRFRGFR